MKMRLKERAKKLKTDIPAIFLALKDKDTPMIAKIFAGITITYALSPVVLCDSHRIILEYDTIFPFDRLWGRNAYWTFRLDMMIERVNGLKLENWAE